jgi:hypothetical protein
VSGNQIEFSVAIATATIAAPSLAHVPTVYADPVSTTAVVLKIVDDDTADIRDNVRGRLRIRLLGIDTPETKKPPRFFTMVFSGTGRALVHRHRRLPGGTRREAEPVGCAQDIAGLNANVFRAAHPTQPTAARWRRAPHSLTNGTTCPPTRTGIGMAPPAGSAWAKYRLAVTFR